MPRRPGWRGLVALGLVLLVVVGAGLAAMTVRLTRPGPGGAVRGYFAALSAGDAERALRYVSAATHLSAKDYPLLTGAALAGAQHRPGDVHVGAVTRIQVTPPSIEAYLVQTGYRVAGQTVTAALVVWHSDGGYLLQAPFVQVGVVDAAGRAVTVNGVALDQQHLTTLAFPGSYDAVAAGNALFAGARAAGRPQPGPGAMSLAEVDFGPPTLAPGALAEIQRQARGKLDACAAGGQPTPVGCPFGLNVPGTATRVQWTITTYPVITATVARAFLGDVGVAVTDDHTGKVHWDIAYIGLDGANRHETGDSDFTVNGSAAPAGTGIQVSLVG